jgi:hypothetical protein
MTSIVNMSPDTLNEGRFVFLDSRLVHNTKPRHNLLRSRGGSFYELTGATVPVTGISRANRRHVVRQTIFASVTELFVDNRSTCRRQMLFNEARKHGFARKRDGVITGQDYYCFLPVLRACTNRRSTLGMLSNRTIYVFLIVLCS